MMRNRPDSIHHERGENGAEKETAEQISKERSTWRYWYLAVLGELAVLVVLFYALGRWAS